MIQFKIPTGKNKTRPRKRGWRRWKWLLFQLLNGVFFGLVGCLFKIPFHSSQVAQWVVIFVLWYLQMREADLRGFTRLAVKGTWSAWEICSQWPECPIVEIVYRVEIVNENVDMVKSWPFFRSRRRWVNKGKIAGIKALVWLKLIK